MTVILQGICCAFQKARMFRSEPCFWGCCVVVAISFSPSFLDMLQTYDEIRKILYSPLGSLAIETRKKYRNFRVFRIIGTKKDPDCFAKGG